MSDQPEIHTINLARLVSVEAVRDSANGVLEELAADLVNMALTKCRIDGLRLTDFKISYRPHSTTLEDAMYRSPAALVDQYDLAITVHAVALASERSL